MMQNATGNRYERQIQFLRHCLELLEDEVCGNRERERQFFHACLDHLQIVQTLPSKRLPDCDLDIPEDNKAHAKTYRSWLIKFALAINNNAVRLEKELRLFGLTRLPVIDYVKGGGAGKESYFQINVEESNSLNTAPVDEGEASTTPEEMTNTVRYAIEKIRRPPWYINLMEPAFKTSNRRRNIALLILMTVFLLLPLSVAYLVVVQPSGIMMLALFTIIFSLELYLTPKATVILRLLRSKIALIDSIGLPLSSVCLSEVSKVPDPGSPSIYVERRLTVMVVSADCPICNKLYGLEKSVMLEQKGFFNIRIIGECWNNPMMHRFTFDKDLMTGNKIK